MNGSIDSSDRKGVAIRADRFLIPAALFLAALAVRLVYLAQIDGTSLTEVLLVDSETYDRFARRILDGTFRGEEVYSMNVLYPWFLALLYRIGGGPWMSVLPVQAVLDAASVVLVYFIGLRFFGRAVAVVAAAVAALYGPFVFYSGALLTPALVGFLTLAGVALLGRAAGGSGGWRAAVGAGLFVGLATLGRGNAVLLIPAGLVHFSLAGMKRSEAVRRGGIFAAAALAFPLGATVRNYAVEGRIVPMAANYAAFYIGHHPEANGLYSMPSFIESARFEGEVLGTREWVSGALGRPVTLAESARVLLRWGMGHVIEDPAGALLRTAKKFYFFWNRTESPTNLNYHFALDFSPLLRRLPFGFGIVAPLGLMGMAWSFRRRRERALLYLTAAVYLFTCLVFFVSAEYRLPAVPILILFAAQGVLALGRALRRRERRGRALAALLALPFLFAFTNYRSPLLEAQTWKRVDYLNFGVLYRDREEFGKARALLERSLEIDPRFGPAHEALAELHARIGDDLAAARHRELAERYALGGQYRGGPGAPDAATADMLEVAELYARGEYEKALAGFEELRDRFDREGNRDLSFRARNNVGLCLYKMGRHEEADREFRVLIEEDPGYVKGWTNLAKVCAARGRTEEAGRMYIRALDLDPNNPRIRQDLERLRRAGAGEGAGP
ncbi:MAG: glycosyltransferase family 39 protein [Candidatus Eisenbacteria bacterium]